MVMFDTGSTVPTLTALAAAILERLAPMRLEPGKDADARGPYVRTLQRIACDPDPRNEYAMDLFRQAAAALPAALLVIGDGEVEPLGAAASQIHEEVAIRLYLACAHGQGPVIGRQEPSPLASNDNRSDPGLDAFGQHIIEGLAGFEPDIAASATALRFKRRRRFVFLHHFHEDKQSFPFEKMAVRKGLSNTHYTQRWQVEADTDEMPTEIASGQTLRGEIVARNPAELRNGFDVVWF